MINSWLSKSVLAVVLVVLTSLQVLADVFPSGPHPRLTPGSLCKTPNSYRYSQQIPYCERNVSTETKQMAFNLYNQLGYKMLPENRADYKIDHFIPLSIGGSNDITNLWPQHKSVYAMTDPMETLVFELIQAGKITQIQAVTYVRTGKLNLKQLPAIIAKLNQLKNSN